MEELRIGNEAVMQEYIITLEDGQQIRMMLDADHFETWNQIARTIGHNNQVANICNYGSKLFTVIGS